MLIMLLTYIRANSEDSVVKYGVLVAGLVLCITQLIISVRFARRQPQHLERQGVLGKSNLADQYNAEYDKSEDSNADEPVRVKALYIHPIKSCKYVELEQAVLTKVGFAYDRCFTFAKKDSRKKSNDSVEWQMITQRTKPMMSQIEVQLWLPHTKSDQRDRLVQSGGCLVVQFPDSVKPSLQEQVKGIFETWTLPTERKIRFLVPLMPTSSMIEEHKITLTPFALHYRTAHGLDMGRIPEVAAALPKLKALLKLPDREELTLFRCTSETFVRTDRNLAPLKYIGTPSVHGYTDQQPVNINTLSSIHAVSSLLPAENQPLNALRFRANIYLTGSPAYSEESWKRIRILPRGSVPKPRAKVSPSLSVVCRTSRCTMPNVDPNRGVFNEDKLPADKKKGRAQPSTTLIEYRTPETGNPQALGYLGMHCVPEDLSLQEAREQDAELCICVGDEIEVVETGVHLYGSTGNDY